jgi:hypothetical protein
MSVIDERSPTTAYDGLARQHLDLRPARGLPIVTCMDLRSNVFAASMTAMPTRYVMQAASSPTT